MKSWSHGVSCPILQGCDEEIVSHYSKCENNYSDNKYIATPYPTAATEVTCS